MYTDPIADMLTRIRNANKARKEYVDIPLSKIKMEIVKILKGENFINEIKEIKENSKKTMRVYLKYTTKKGTLLLGIRRVSTPGLRKFCGYREIPKVFGGRGIAIISTPKGIVTNREAKAQKVGGEILCYVW